MGWNQLTGSIQWEMDCSNSYRISLETYFVTLILYVDPMIHLNSNGQQMPRLS